MSRALWVCLEVENSARVKCLGLSQGEALDKCLYEINVFTFVVVDHYSPLLSRLTVLACDSTQVTSFL